ncbi:MAG: hypothetical protein J6S67_04160 [Methanobrevibacter sp.]|nr:hypothetical protein [Methanobrevibacter sp.]
MKMSELTKYQKSRLCKCIFCGKEITEFQEFEFACTKFGRCNVYAFIHSDCIVAANEWAKGADKEKLQKAAAIAAIKYYMPGVNISDVELTSKDLPYVESDSIGRRSEDDGK